MDTIQPRWALVTGASAGIGRAFAHQLAKKGFNVIVTARRLQRLNQLKEELSTLYQVQAIAIADDLAEAGAPKRLVDAVAAEGKSVEVLVNNAGYGLPGRYANTRWQDQAALLQVLVTAVCELTHRLLPSMIERGSGRIINVSSIAGLVPGSAGHTLYSASKSFLIRFTESLWLELEGTGVFASAVCPGFTRSEFHDVNGTRSLVNRLPAFMWMDADAVARQAIDAVMRNQLMCVTGFWNKLLTVGSRFIPYRLAMYASRYRSKRIHHE